jgi:hypothetical protein
LDLHLTSSLRNLVQSTLGTRYAVARRRAAEDLNEYDEGAEDLPEACPYTLEQILSHDWFPANLRDREG